MFYSCDMFQSFDMCLNHVTCVWVNWNAFESRNMHLSHVTRIPVTWHMFYLCDMYLSHVTCVWVTWHAFESYYMHQSHATHVWDMQHMFESRDTCLSHKINVQVTWNAFKSYGAHSSHIIRMRWSHVSVLRRTFESWEMRSSHGHDSCSSHVTSCDTRRHVAGDITWQAMVSRLVEVTTCLVEATRDEAGQQVKRGRRCTVDRRRRNLSSSEDAPVGQCQKILRGQARIPLHCCYMLIASEEFELR